MVIQRGELWWASLPEPTGSEPGYRRPVLVVQTDSFNASRIATVIAVVVTSNLNLERASGNVLLPRKVSGLPKDSVVNVSQLVTVDKTFLTERIGRLPMVLLQEIEKGLKLVLDLT
jgi:mRNA interferase MazF